jgi:hypothetical protein
MQSSEKLGSRAGRSGCDLYFGNNPNSSAFDFQSALGEKLDSFGIRDFFFFKHSRG